ncbi:hypothetical protein PAHAL_6G171800 [Panicum hallii]|uniref:Uncharacterized protein n=1 Tax=Panicum hallii TaxID=206008 RepID=A0A2T8IGK9_9POAL|nr:hypothetical protein PAHAL_6G171800 [Panicum hallii]
MTSILLCRHPASLKTWRWPVSNHAGLVVERSATAAATGGAEGRRGRRWGPCQHMGATVRILGNGLLAAPAYPAYPVEVPDHIHANVGLGEFEIFGDAAKGPAVRAVHGLQHIHAAAWRTEDGHCSTTVEARAELL